MKYEHIKQVNQCKIEVRALERMIRNKTDINVLCDVCEILQQALDILHNHLCNDDITYTQRRNI